MDDTRSLVRMLSENPLLYEKLSFELKSLPHVARAAVLAQGSMAQSVPAHTVPSMLLEHWKQWSVMFAGCMSPNGLWALSEGQRCHWKLLHQERRAHSRDIVGRAPEHGAEEALLEAVARAEGLHAEAHYERAAQLECVRVLQKARRIIARHNGKRKRSHNEASTLPWA